MNYKMRFHTESKDDNVRVSEEEVAEMLQSMGWNTWNTNNKRREKYWYFKVFNIVILLSVIFVFQRELAWYA
jgi:hypothetical protein